MKKPTSPSRATRIASMNRQKERARRLIRDVWHEDELSGEPR
jgi:hypothetical protein